VGFRPDYRLRQKGALQISAAPYEYTPLKKSYPWAWHRRMIRDVRRAQPLFAGDYYPLTGCTPGTDQWAAYQMHRPDLGEGLVMALRRQDSPFGEATFRLQGLKPRSVYEVEDADSGRKVRVAGRKLMEEGIKVSLKSAPESRLIFYRVVR
jgi:alpha-galactosidase